MIAFPARMRNLVGVVRQRLEDGLDHDLYYHGAHHTLEDVLPAADRLCRSEGVSEADRELVLLAALFHDTGFLERYNGNETIGARIAAEVLPDWEYSSQEIERILDLILATELHEVDGVMLQVPGPDLLKCIMCDADLDNLGREDFFHVSNALRREIEEHGRKLGDLEWLSRQVVFVSQHRWFTESQRRLREPRKQENLRTLHSLLAGTSARVGLERAV